MKAQIVGYWICTVLIGLSYLSSGAAHLLRVPQVVESMTHLGYPAHFVITMGIWKVLSGAAVLLPGFPLLKEWAYAFMIFDITGAAVAHAAVGDNVGLILVQFFLAALVVASWALRPEGRKLKRAVNS